MEGCVRVNLFISMANLCAFSVIEKRLVHSTGDVAFGELSRATHIDDGARCLKKGSEC
jgi:precorrin isomerase